MGRPRCFGRTIGVSAIAFALVTLAIAGSARAAEPAFRLAPPISGFNKSAYGAVPLEVNGDGKPDLAVLSIVSVSVWEINVLRGNGDGTFTPGTNPWEQVTLPFGARGDFRAGDVTGDGREDLVISGWDETTLAPATRSIRLYLAAGDPRGGFAPPVTIHTVATGPTASVPLDTSFALCDTNGDGKLDIAYMDTQAARVRQLIGNGQGGFTPGTLAAPVTFKTGVPVGRLVAHDLDGDHRDDLVALAGPTMSVLIASPATSTGFLPATNYTTTADLFDTASFTDPDRDGIVDLFVSALRPVSGISKYESYLYRGVGHGTFDPRVTPVPMNDEAAPAESQPDLNGDGYPDLLARTGPWPGKSVTVLPTTDGGPFGPPATFLVGTSIDTKSVDLNLDGRLDLVAYSYDGIRVLINATAYPPPRAHTGTASGVTRTAATLTGSVAPRGQPTSYRFEYGPTATYGSRTPDAAVDPGPLTAPAAARIVALDAGSTIHYRLVVTNRFGTTFGEDQALTTMPLVGSIRVNTRWKMSRQIGSLVLDQLPPAGGPFRVTLRLSGSTRVISTRSVPLPASKRRSTIPLPRGIQPGSYDVMIVGPDETGAVTTQTTRVTLASPPEGYARAYFSRHDGSPKTTRIARGARVIWVNYRFVTAPVPSARTLTQTCTGPVRIAPARRAYKRSLTISLSAGGALPTGTYTCTLRAGPRRVPVASAGVRVG